MSYATERLAAWEAMALASMYGGTLNYGGTNYDCVAEPINSERMMAQAGWQQEKTSKFTMRKTDWLASGMENRSTFDYQGSHFEINSVTLNPNDGIVLFTARLKK